jgi:hypothetical protein
MPYSIRPHFPVSLFNREQPAPFDATSNPGREVPRSGPGRTLQWLLGCLTMASISLTLSAQSTFTNSGTLSVTLNGTNLVFNYSMATNQGYVTLLSASDLGTLSASPQAVNYALVPPSRQGQFVVPMNPNAPVRFFRLLSEQWPSYYLNYPDLSDILPSASGQISIVGTGTNRVFQYTHDTYNGGTGPLEIQPVYNTNSGNYMGYQHVYFFHSNTWTLAKTIPVAGAFVFDVAHGHFHFPFAVYGLYAANPDGSIGSLLIPSPKDGFCIGDSYLYNSSLPNAGTFGYVAACSDPMTLRGLSIGCVDEYDQSDEGQSIPIPYLTNGIYWLKSMVDPFNYLAEGIETNNETEVKLSISNSTVRVLQTISPALTPPPGITLTLPGSTNLSGTVQLTANTSVTNGSGVQFLVDGLAFGNVVSNPPYVLSWDTTSVLNGTHWLAAQIADSTGHYGCSPVILVMVTNVSTIPPIVQITDPVSNSTVSAVITVSVTAAAQVGIPIVQFYVDSTPLGAPVTAPPFMTTWNTEPSTAGLHVLTASAVDQDGLSNNSTPVSVTVDNSHPANTIGIDVTKFQDGTNVLQTPAFSTTTTSDLLVAFVAYDGPSNGPQTATVSGGGLNWLLAKRSNIQHGTAEIWVANATDFLTSVSILAQPGVPGYDGSLTVVAFTNAAGPGVVGQASAPTGAPDIYIPGVLTGNWVFAVGNDWDHATARMPVSGQVLVHQKLDTVAGDTYWVQSTTAPSVADGLVDIHDSSPTNDEWNYCAIEVVATRQ